MFRSKALKLHFNINISSFPKNICIKNARLNSHLLSFKPLGSDLLLKPFAGIRYKQSFHTSIIKLEKNEGKAIDNRKPPVPEQFKQIYEGPLAKTAKYLKVFSISSLILTFSLAPLIFVIDAGLSPMVRSILFGAAIVTSGVSTALIHWCIHPYVTRGWVDVKTLKDGTSLSGETKLCFESINLLGKFDYNYLLAKDLSPSSRLFTTHKLNFKPAGKTPQPLYYIHPEVAEMDLIMNQFQNLSSGKLEALRFTKAQLKKE